MAIHAPSRARVRFAVAVFSAALLSCAFHTVVIAASPVPDGVSLSESAIAWSTVKYATDAENGLVSGSPDEMTVIAVTHPGEDVHEAKKLLVEEIVNAVLH